jgi:VanZ family protein
MSVIASEPKRVNYRWMIWVVCVAAWTLALVTPQPVQVAHEILPDEATYPAAKTLHISMYASLTILSAWMPMRRGRWCLLIFLSLHGMATEYIQTYVPGRFGCWRDVGFDHIGIALGVGVTWKRWWRFACASCGQTVVVRKGTEPTDLCPLCVLRGRVNALTADQRGALHRLARSGRPADLLTEAQFILGVPADEKVMRVTDLMAILAGMTEE